MSASTGRRGRAITIHAIATVAEARPSRSKPDRGYVRMAYDVRNQRDETVLSYEIVHILTRRSARHLDLAATCMRPSSARKIRAEQAMSSLYDGPIIDAHHHLWELDSGRYAWLTDGPA